MSFVESCSVQQVLSALIEVEPGKVVQVVTSAVFIEVEFRSNDILQDVSCYVVFFVVVGVAL